jgi:hypothetical protein
MPIRGGNFSLRTRHRIRRGLFRLAFARYKHVARSRSVLQSRGTEDERAAFAAGMLQHSGLGIVDEHLKWNPAEEFEGVLMSAQEVFGIDVIRAAAYGLLIVGRLAEKPFAVARRLYTS